MIVSSNKSLVWRYSELISLGYVRYLDRRTCWEASSPIVLFAQRKCVLLLIKLQITAKIIRRPLFKAVGFLVVIDEQFTKNSFTALCPQFSKEIFKEQSSILDSQKLFQTGTSSFLIFQIRQLHCFVKMGLKLYGTGQIHSRRLNITTLPHNDDLCMQRRGTQSITSHKDIVDGTQIDFEIVLW